MGIDDFQHSDDDPPNDGTPLLPNRTREGSNVDETYQPAFESLDFDRIINTFSISATKSRIDNAASSDHCRTCFANTSTVFLGITITRWILTALVGLATGITAITIVHCVDQLVEFRVARLNVQMQNVFGSYDEEETFRYYQKLSLLDTLAKYRLVGIYAFYGTYNIVLVVLSTALCVLFAPMAVGSGIPEVKAYLNGIRVGEFAGLRLYCIKLLGTILGVSSGLVVGPEGPTVHLGAIVRVLGCGIVPSSGLLLLILIPYKFLIFLATNRDCQVGCLDDPN